MPAVHLVYRVVWRAWELLMRVLPPQMLVDVAEETFQREIIRDACKRTGLAELLSKAGDDGVDFPQVCSGLAIPAQSTRVLLLVACAAKLVCRREGKYYATRELVRDLSAPLIFDAFRTTVYYPGLFYFAESCMKGSNAGLQVLPGRGETLYERLAGHPALERQYSAGLAEMAATYRAPVVIAALRRVRGKVKHVLDVGGNTGAMANAIAREFPDMRVTVFDLPSLGSEGAKDVDATRAGPVHFVSGNALSDPFPPADCILYCAFLEVIPGPQVSELLEKAYAALPAHGSLVVAQLVCDDSETGPWEAARNSYYFFNLCAPNTMTRPVADFREWSKKIGFRSFESLTVKESPLVAMILHK
jgi:ubiquinone/menaquinone biosynthesis C-methylase UbiE